ncbi:hypothetical protein GCM10009616_15240 [Microlunatus lacustris]
MIALVGTSSVGKTSVAEQLQVLLPEPHLVVGIDHFLNMFPQHWAGQPRGPGPGLWYEDTIDPDGRPRARIRYGSAGERLLTGMRAAVRAMLECGNQVILDEMPLDQSILPAWKRDLAGTDAVWVRLSAPLDVVEGREAARTRGQHLGNARGHLHIGVEEDYDLHLDVATRSPSEAAAAILAAHLW